MHVYTTAILNKYINGSYTPPHPPLNYRGLVAATTATTYKQRKYMSNAPSLFTWHGILAGRIAT